MGVVAPGEKKSWLIKVTDDNDARWKPEIDGTECSETTAYKIQTPGNYPEESI